jgi:hypothetical protein
MLVVDAVPVPQHPKHWSGLLPAITVLVNVTGNAVKSPPP